MGSNEDGGSILREEISYTPATDLDLGPALGRAALEGLASARR